MTPRPILLAIMAAPLALSGCAGLDRSDQGALQPQTVSGPCQVSKFFLLSHVAVHTTMAVDASGQACSFTLINPDLQASPTAALVTNPPGHGQATAGLANGGSSAFVSYTPTPGYHGTDQFAATIEPNDHAIAVAVTVR